MAKDDHIVQEDYDFSFEKQKLLLQYLISEPHAFTVAQTILKADYFDDALKPAVRFVLEYAEKANTIPMVEQIKAQTGLQIDKLSEVSSQHTDGWCLPFTERFCRYKALESAVLDGVEMITDGRGGELEQRVKDAMSISLLRDLGTDYFKDPLTRLDRMKDRSQYRTTGWKSLDEKLYGGFTVGGLNIFAGGSGSGKSLVLQNLALNWAQMGLTVAYMSLELSEDLCALRFDSMVSGYGTKQIFTNINDVCLRIKKDSMENKGVMIIKKLPEAGTTSNTIRAFLKEFEIKTGRRVDCLVVDYLDLMHPINSKINPSDLFVKDKYVSEELRALMSEFALIGATASQLNRGSVEAVEHDHSHIAGGLSKINTADLVVSLLATATMKEQGRYQFQFLKTRSSNAVGSKLEMKFDPVSLRILDADEFLTRPSGRDEVRDELAKKAGEPEEPISAPRLDISALMSKIRSNG